VNEETSILVREPGKDDANKLGFVEVWDADYNKWIRRFWFDFAGHPSWTEPQRIEIRRRYPKWRAIIVEEETPIIPGDDLVMVSRKKLESIHDELMELASDERSRHTDNATVLMTELLASEAPEANIRIELFQQDWMEGFAAYLHDGTRHKDANPHIAINVGAFMAAVNSKQITQNELPYMVAESLMHEFIHVLEAWAGVEFSEAKVENLLAKYREACNPNNPSPNLRLVGEDGIPEVPPPRWTIEPCVDGDDEADGAITDSDEEAKALILKTAESELWDQHDGGERMMRVMFDPTVPEKK
jgi:hypothetical protein